MTSPDPAAGVAEVLPVDREAAAAIYHLLGFGPCQHIIDGMEDDIGVVQLVAAHRLLATERLEAGNEELTAKVDHLEHVIDRDRYVVASAVAGMQRAIASRAWLFDGRGSYAWDDDEFREEFGAALYQIELEMKPLAIVAWDKSDCTRIEERVKAARAAAQELLAKPHGPRDMILSDVCTPPEVADLQRQLADANATIARLASYAAPTPVKQEKRNGQG